MKGCHFQSPLNVSIFGGLAKQSFIELDHNRRINLRGCLPVSLRPSTSYHPLCSRQNMTCSTASKIALSTFYHCKTCNAVSCHPDFGSGGQRQMGHEIRNALRY